MAPYIIELKAIASDDGRLEVTPSLASAGTSIAAAMQGRNSESHM